MAAVEKRSGNWRAMVGKSGSLSINTAFTKKSGSVRRAPEPEREIQLGFSGEEARCSPWNGGEVI